MRLIYSFILGLSLTVSAYAQQQCNLNLSQSPTLRGFRLGMELKQAFENLPLLQMRAEPDEIGHIKAYVSTKNLEGDKRDAYRSILDGVEAIILEFKESRIARVTVLYDDSVKWNSVNQFTLKVSSGLGLPTRWHIYEGIAGLECKGFSLIAWLERSRSVLDLRDTRAMRTPEEIQAEKEERARRTFRP